MDDEILRKGLLELLDMGSAHITLDEALRDLGPAQAFRRPSSNRGGEPELRSIWELLEHMRLAQEDILRYTIDPAWQSPPFPEGLWPELGPDLSIEDGQRQWRATLDAFRSDLDQIRSWLSHEKFQLTNQIPHGEGRTYLRQVLLVADHNAYHLGQIVSVRRMLGLWR